MHLCCRWSDGLQAWCRYSSCLWEVGNYNAALNYKKSSHWDHRLLIRVAFIKDLSGFPLCCELAFR